MMPPPGRIDAHNEGVVLVIVLALIVLLTGLIVAFFSQATSSFQVEVSHGNRSQADLLARSATDYVVGQFEQEIADTGRSSVHSSSGVSIYVPLQNTFAVPKRAVGSNVPATAAFSNLIRQSAPTADPNASTDSTAAPAVNGRLLTTGRWNLPALLSGNGFDSSSELPNWVYFTQTNGPANSATTAAIGRFAYNVYDEGGLLDANVAGYPTNVASKSYQLKGTQAGADLTQISGVAQADVDKLVAFRNPDVSSAADYLDCVAAANSKGFLASIVTSPATQRTFKNNYFASRQDLLHYVSTQNTGLKNALPYLTTTSRAMLGPSTQPAVDAANGYTYLTSAESTTLAGATNPNRDLANVRFPAAGTITHYADDGTTTTYTVAAGDPAIQQRFSLAKLAWVTYNGPKSGVSAAAIQACFGLTWDGTRWTYVGVSGSTAQSTIDTVDAVASENREPNFFEVLQAAILKGSLGRDAGPAGGLDSNGDVEYTCAIKSYEGTISDVQSQDKDVVRHALQIGANIIDQADTDSYPTAIRYLDPTSASGATAEVYGIENLPYPARTIPTGVQSFGATQNAMNFYLQVEMWNPHQQTPAPAAGTYPTSFRVRDDPGAPSVIEIRNNSVFPRTYSPSYELDQSGEIDFSNAAGASGFLDPALLTSSNSTTTYPQNNGGTGYPVNLGGASPVPVYGLLCGAINASSTNYVFAATPYPAPTMLSLVYEYQSNGNWYPYARTRRMKYHGTMVQMFSASAHPTVGNGNYTGDNTSDVHLDPRTDRFGCFGRWCDPAAFTNAGQQLAFFPPGYKFSVWPSYTQNIGGNVYCPKPSTADSTSAFTMTLTSVGSYAGNGYCMGRLADNVVAAADGTANYYKDIDGTVRGGAGYWAASAGSANGTDGRPLFTGNTASRPVILNRPFQSVGELGYVFRDVPWKELDLFTPDSGDAALLDAFCVADAGRVSAGKINLNTPNKPVLQALLSGATKDPALASTLTSTEATNLANLLVTRTTGTGAAQGPLVSTADLVRKFSTDLSSGYSTASDPLIKLRRETAARALADVGNTRTWNLMIDVVAQTGMCRQAGQFIVQGEKRYWVHVAIDRYTGKVVDESLENVNE